MSTPIILDANSLAVRCIMATALEDLRAGIQPTGGVYGSLNTLRSLITIPGLLPGAIYACFDAGVPPKRLELLPDYKAERKAKRNLFTADEKERVFSQVRLVKEMFSLMGIVCLKYKQREADDVVAAVARLCMRRGESPLVLTGDRDLWQTVGLGASVWDFNKKALIEADNFTDYADVPIEHYLLFKAMVGDSSDSIQGAPGVGPSRAVQLLTAHAPEGTPAEQLDALVDALTHLKKRRKFEQSVVDSHAHLHRVLQAIDLTRSFGKTHQLAKAMERRPPCALKPFLRFCKSLRFGSVLRDPHKFFRPFRDALDRRESA